MGLAGDRLRAWRESPLTFVREVFRVEPDPWQAEALEEFPRRPRMAMKACKGPGKTATLAWLAWNFLLTRSHPKVAATSITAENLADNLWTEMAKWQARAPLLKAAFTWTKTRIVANDHPETWWMSARTWPKTGDKNQQADTLAGLHADYLLFIADESGGIPEAVMVAAEAGLSSCVEGHIIQAGNPTHLTGPLYRACTASRDLWYIVEITGDPDDPKRSPRVSIEWAREQIRTYGRDNPWVLVNVFGRFPPSSLNALIGPDEVRDAMRRQHLPTVYGNLAKILGVDVARFGDDASVIFPRQGLQAFVPVALRNVDSVQGAARVSQAIATWGAHATFVDGSGGYGAGWIDQLRVLGREVVDVQFGGAATDPRYHNKRTEMYFDAVQWIRAGGALPEIPELVADLSEPTYTFVGDRMALEAKDQIKARIGRSPDHGDALALTFAAPVAPPPADIEALKATLKKHDSRPAALAYNPLRRR